MNEPTFDRDGYPTDETLLEIEQFPHEEGPYAFLEFVQKVWSDYGVIRGIPGEDKTRIEFVTGGWSGNESIIQSMERNIFFPLHWQSSHRGGLHVFEIPLNHE